MARKVFISILGISYYNRTKYYFDTKSDFIETRFIQEATLKFLSQGWNKNDHAYFFLTKDAKETNWSSPAQTNHYLVRKGERDTYTGLKEVIEKCSFPYDHTTVNIPNGNNEKEIWQIFETVFGVLEENDEVYFDITHAFRSIPMLVMVLINYAKFLKNISVISITYGNWEGRDKDNNLAPIIDLTAFSELQDWTSAANLFVNHGNMVDLANLTKQEVTPVLKTTKGKDKTAKNLKQISDSLSRISLAFKTNNAPEIINGKLFSEFDRQFSEMTNNMIKPLSPILVKVAEKIANFSTDGDVFNGLKAVDFCIDSGLIQQAYTMLQESIISIVLHSENLDLKNVGYRDIVSGAFKIKQENYPVPDWKKLNRDNEELTNKFLKNNFLSELVPVFNALTDKRNIINHAGFNKKSSEKVFKNLEKNIIDYNNRVKEKLDLIE